MRSTPFSRKTAGSASELPFDYVKVSNFGQLQIQQNPRLQQSNLAAKRKVACHALKPTVVILPLSLELLQSRGKEKTHQVLVATSREPFWSPWGKNTTTPHRATARKKIRSARLAKLAKKDAAVVAFESSSLRVVFESTPQRCREAQTGEPPFERTQRRRKKLGHVRYLLTKTRKKPWPC